MTSTMDSLSWVLAQPNSTTEISTTARPDIDTRTYVGSVINFLMQFSMPVNFVQNINRTWLNIDKRYVLYFNRPCKLIWPTY
jgi:hypothetical protein